MYAVQCVCSYATMRRRRWWCRREMDGGTLSDRQEEEESCCVLSASVPLSGVMQVCAMQVTSHCSQTDSSSYELVCVRSTWSSTPRLLSLALICSSLCRLGWTWMNAR